MLDDDGDVVLQHATDDNFSHKYIAPDNVESET